MLFNKFYEFIIITPPSGHSTCHNDETGISVSWFLFDRKIRIRSICPWNMASAKNAVDGWHVYFRMVDRIQST